MLEPYGLPAPVTGFSAPIRIGSAADAQAGIEDAIPIAPMD